MRHISCRWSRRFFPIPLSVSSDDLDDVCFGEGDVRQSAYAINIARIADENLVVRTPVPKSHTHDDVAHARFGQSPDVFAPLASELKRASPPCQAGSGSGSSLALLGPDPPKRIKYSNAPSGYPGVFVDHPSSGTIFDRDKKATAMRIHRIARGQFLECRGRGSMLSA